MASKSAMSLMMQAPKKKAPAKKGAAIAAPAMAMAPPPMPSHDDMLKEDMQHAKRNATRSWVEGHLSPAKHAQVHARANKVLKGMKVGR